MAPRPSLYASVFLFWKLQELVNRKSHGRGKGLGYPVRCTMLTAEHGFGSLQKLSGIRHWTCPAWLLQLVLVFMPACWALQYLQYDIQILLKRNTRNELPELQSPACKRSTHYHGAKNEKQLQLGSSEWCVVYVDWSDSEAERMGFQVDPNWAWTTIWAFTVHIRLGGPFPDNWHHHFFFR